MSDINYDEVKYAGITSSQSMTSTLETQVPELAGTVETFALATDVNAGDLVSINSNGTLYPTIGSVTTAGVWTNDTAAYVAYNKYGTKNEYAGWRKVYNVHNAVHSAEDYIDIYDDTGLQGTIAVSTSSKAITPTLIQFMADKKILMRVTHRGRNSGNEYDALMILEYDADYNMTLSGLQHQMPLNHDYNYIATNGDTILASAGSGGVPYWWIGSVSGNTITKHATPATADGWGGSHDIAPMWHATFVPHPTEGDKFIVIGKDVNGMRIVTMMTADITNNTLQTTHTYAYFITPGSSLQPDGNPALPQRIFVDPNNSSIIYIGWIGLENNTQSARMTRYNVSGTFSVTLDTTFNAVIYENISSDAWQQGFGNNDQDVLLTPDGTKIFAIAPALADDPVTDVNGNQGNAFLYNIADGTTEVVNLPIAGNFNYLKVTDLGSKWQFRDSNNNHLLTLVPGSTNAVVTADAKTNLFGIAHTSGTTGNEIQVIADGSTYKGYTGLTPGSIYYMDTDGSLTTTVTDTMVGKAYASNNLKMTISDVEKNTHNMDFTLAEDITAGSVVQLDALGQIENIAMAGTLSDISSSYSTIFESIHASGLDVAWSNDNSTFVITYRNGGTGQGEIVSGTLSDNIVTIGSTYEFESGSAFSKAKIEFLSDSSTKFVVSWIYDGQLLKAAVGTIAGSTISFGATVQAPHTSNAFNMVPVPGNENKLLLVSKVISQSNCGKIGELTVDGTTVSITTLSTIVSEYFDLPQIEFIKDSLDTFVVTCYTSSIKTAVIAGTYVNGTVTMGTPAVISTNVMLDTKIIMESESQFAVVAGTRNWSVTNSISIYPCVLSGTTITVNSSTTLVNDAPAGEDLINYYTAAVGNNGYGILAYTKMTTFDAEMIPFSFNGSSITLEAPISVAKDKFSQYAIDIDSNNRFVIVGADTAYDATTKTSSVIHGQLDGMLSSNLDADKIVGVLQENGVTGDAKSVLMIGMDSSHTDLTSGSIYYVQENGSITTSSASPAIKVGLAVSDTTIKLSL